jgi:hypothetical protein
MTLPDTQRLAWFDAGATAFAASCPAYLASLESHLRSSGKLQGDFPPLYLCPLCTVRLFDRQAVLDRRLTAEHVPMERLGGVELVLTCADCNHRGGYGPDAAARRERNPIDAFKGKLGQPHPVRVWLETSRTRSGTMQPVSVNMRFETSDGGYKFMGRDGIDPPGQQGAFKAELSRLAAEGEQDFEFKIDFDKDRHHAQLARVSYLRAAYLVAFAQFGYACILHPTWAQVRQQIQNPKDEIITRFRLVMPGVNDEERRLMIVKEPERARSLGVQFGPMFVLLPLRGDSGLYDRLKSGPGDVKGLVQVRGTELCWPTRPIHAWDRHK